MYQLPDDTLSQFKRTTGKPSQVAEGRLYSAIRNQFELGEKSTSYRNQFNELGEGTLKMLQQANPDAVIPQDYLRYRLENQNNPITHEQLYDFVRRDYPFMPKFENEFVPIEEMQARAGQAPQQPGDGPEAKKYYDSIVADIEKQAANWDAAVGQLQTNDPNFRGKVKSTDALLGEALARANKAVEVTESLQGRVAHPTWEGIKAGAVNTVTEPMTWAGVVATAPIAVETMAGNLALRLAGISLIEGGTNALTQAGVEEQLYNTYLARGMTEDEAKDKARGNIVDAGIAGLVVGPLAYGVGKAGKAIKGAISGVLDAFASKDSKAISRALDKLEESGVPLSKDEKARIDQIRSAMRFQDSLPAAFKRTPAALRGAAARVQRILNGYETDGAASVEFHKAEMTRAYLADLADQLEKSPDRQLDLAEVDGIGKLGNDIKYRDLPRGLSPAQKKVIGLERSAAALRALDDTLTDPVAKAANADEAAKLTAQAQAIKGKMTDFEAATVNTTVDAMAKRDLETGGKYQPGTRSTKAEAIEAIKNEIAGIDRKLPELKGMAEGEAAAAKQTPAEPLTTKEPVASKPTEMSKETQAEVAKVLAQKGEEAAHKLLHDENVPPSIKAMIEQEYADNAAELKELNDVMACIARM